jgi:lysylphosphatidylglycerol synthetase-like protein (DUF2156 family)
MPSVQISFLNIKLIVLVRDCDSALHAISIWSPLVAILLMVPSIALFTTKNTTAKWILFAVLCLPVLLITISRLPFPIISRLMDRALDTKKISDSEILHVCCASDVGVHA